MAIFELTKEEVADLYYGEMIVDGVRGGLILGDRHSDPTGGIYLMLFDSGKPYCIGQMEGGEYLVNCIATRDNLELLDQINNDRSDDDEDICKEEIESVRHVFVPSGHWLLVSAAASRIINRSATKKHLKKLDEINKTGQEVFDAHQDD